jgi:probable phosphoglycerate mutase
MELLLIRHALPVRRTVSGGRADPELAPDGLLQAEHLARYLAEETIHAIYASPLSRARQTAEPMARARSMEIQIEDGVAEYDRDSSEYVPVEELKATNDPRWQAMLAGEWDHPELTREQWVQGVVDSVEGIITRHASQKVAVVCHGGVVSAYLAWVLGTDNRSNFFYPNYTSIHRVAAARSGERQILTINETFHLRGTGLPVGIYGG